MSAQFGLHRGVVVDNDDPQGRLRLRVVVPALGTDGADWAEACVSAWANALPPTGAGVWVAFENGDIRRPVWMGAVVPPG